MAIQFPEQIETQRLILRVPRPEDGPAVTAAVLASMKALQQWMPWATPAYRDADGEAWCRRTRAAYVLQESFSYTLIDPASGDFLGDVGCVRADLKVPMCEIGYWLRTDRVGSGLMTEAVNGVVAMLNRVPMRRIEIRCDDRNKRSAAVAKRCGFDYEGTLRCDALDPRGKPRSTMIFSRIRTD